MSERNDARLLGLDRYISSVTCPKCAMEGWRRTCDNKCLECKVIPAERARNIKQARKEQVRDAKRRARENCDSTYWSSIPCKLCEKQGDHLLRGNQCLECWPALRPAR